jgi:hypothetical protein
VKDILYTLTKELAPTLPDRESIQALLSACFTQRNWQNIATHIKETERKLSTQTFPKTQTLQYQWELSVCQTLFNLFRQEPFTTPFPPPYRSDAPYFLMPYTIQLGTALDLPMERLLLILKGQETTTSPCKEILRAEEEQYSQKLDLLQYDPKTASPEEAYDKSSKMVLLHFQRFPFLLVQEIRDLEMQMHGHWTAFQLSYRLPRERNFNVQFHKWLQATQQTHHADFWSSDVEQLAKETGQNPKQLFWTLLTDFLDEWTFQPNKSPQKPIGDPLSIK